LSVKARDSETTLQHVSRVEMEWDVT
jgi:hypothetical protein